jgi:nucleoside phosphorylase
MTVLAVTGLTKEAEIVGTAGVVAVAGGGDGDGLAAKLDALHGDIRGVISIGLAGGLSPHLKVGDVVIADRIITGAVLPRARVSALDAGEVAVAGSRASEGRRGQETWDCHEVWRVRLMSRLPTAIQGQIFGSDIIIEKPQTKAGLHETTGALAVDMESQIAARFAARRNLPLAGLRVISDDSNHVLPPAALVAMKPDGGIAIGRVLGSLLRNPAQIPSLVRTARGSNKAFAELLRCRDLCGVGIAGLDL